MPYTILFSQAAEDDTQQAYNWYDEQKKGLGAVFIEFLSAAIDSIADSPLKTQIRYKNVRVFFMQKFPFGIHFRVNDDHSILIAAVFHTSISPDRWNR